MGPLPEIVDDSFEKQLKQNYPVVWWATLFGPLVLSLAILVILALINGTAFVYKLLGTIFVTFFFFGRFVILGGTDPEISEIQRFFSAEFLFCLVLYMDTMVATMLVFHAGFLFKIPKLGNVFTAIAEDSQFILKKNPWMRRVAFIGLMLFVSFPLAATGSVGGAILSRILGMGKILAFFSIFAGSALGGGIMYFGAHIINHYLPRDNPFVTASGIALIGLIIILLNLWYRKLKAADKVS